MLPDPRPQQLTGSQQVTEQNHGVAQLVVRFGSLAQQAAMDPVVPLVPVVVAVPKGVQAWVMGEHVAWVVLQQPCCGGLHWVSGTQPSWQVPVAS